MKNEIYVLVIVGLLVVVGGAALAYGGAQDSTRGMMGMETYHDQMEEIMESGSYADLEALREETGFSFRMIENQEDFEAMQAHHEKMEGMMSNGKQDHACPMMSGQKPSDMHGMMQGGMMG